MGLKMHAYLSKKGGYKIPPISYNALWLSLKNERLRFHRLLGFKASTAELNFRVPKLNSQSFSGRGGTESG